MKFKDKLSTKQVSSIFFIGLGILILAMKLNSLIIFSKVVGLSMILISISNFVIETKRRYQIINPFKKNWYDSKAEKKIAEYFKRKNIIFEHHPRLFVPKLFWKINIPFINIRLEPDFFLPEFNIFVEYWGLIENKDYKEKSYKFKKRLYKENCLDLISLYPKNLKNLDFDFTSKLLEVMKEREGNRRFWR